MIGVSVISLASIVYALNYIYHPLNQLQIFSNNKASTAPNVATTTENIATTTVDIIQDETMHIVWNKPTEIGNLKITNANIDQSSHYYKVGHVLSGSYQNSDLIIASIPCDGPCNDSIYYFIKSVGTTTLLSSHSENLYDGDYLNRKKFIVDASTTLSELIFPEKINYGNGTLTLENGNTQNSFFSDIYKPSDIKLAFVDQKLGNVYTDLKTERSENGPMIRNGFYIQAPDGTIRTYSLDTNFYDKNHSVPNLKWNDLATSTSEYSNTDRTGCGSRNFASVVSGVSMSDLIITGKTSYGDPIYELKDSQHIILKNIYNNDYNPYSYSDSKNLKMPYDQFIKSHPAFFWYDSFGRLIKFQKLDFIPQAECGKPVIYLYPKTTTTISVQVSPKGGLTKSDPNYENGWNVVATPDSELTDVTSGKIYPYLFWEGRGGIYETPKKGFVVDQSNIHTFLIEKLTKLGLNKKEQTDFIEFWEPKMIGSPYYFVTFLGTDDMNKIAPLTITPKPDTVIRILMDFTPLKQPIHVDGYEIKTPTRDGYTVVEWGGVLR